ncbi:MAG: copper amine oxidase N-terminal domain-containing protein [Candidatus Xenobia bacterium]
MRKSLLIIPLLVVALTLSAQAVAIQVLVNGHMVAFDQPPIVANGRVLVPLRGVFEQLGARVYWDPVTRTITAIRGDRRVVLRPGDPTATVDGTRTPLDQPPEIVAGRAMVPLRFVSQAMGATVAWNPATASVTVNGPLATILPPPVPRPVMVATGPIISSVTVSSPGPFQVGQEVHVRMYGQPGGRASFDIGPHHHVVMVEARAGVYVGTWHVLPSDNFPNSMVTGHLVMPDGRRAAMNAPVAVQLGVSQLITGITHTGHRLHPGQNMTVTMYGVPGGQAWFDVGHRGHIPMTQVSPGVYVGSYTAALLDFNHNARIVGHLVLPDGRQAILPAPTGVAIVGY